MDDHLPKQNLVHGEYYIGSCRNADVARWNGDESVFYHWREKFGSRFIETICCPEDDDKYDVFIAKKRIYTPKEEIPFK